MREANETQLDPEDIFSYHASFYDHNQKILLPEKPDEKQYEVQEVTENIWEPLAVLNWQDKLEVFDIGKVRRKRYLAKDKNFKKAEAVYACYEPEISGFYTENEMKKLYVEAVDKDEYPDYVGWKWDMLRSGVFMKIK